MLKKHAAVARKFSAKKATIKNLAKFTENQLWRSLFSDRVAGCRPDWTDHITSNFRRLFPDILLVHSPFHCSTWNFTSINCGIVFMFLMKCRSYWTKSNTSHQKQSFANVFQNGCSKKFRKFHRKTPVLEYLFNNKETLTQVFS